ncbi:MAG: hypothetical protein ACM3UV_00805 [Nocardioidaceae bacterium]
MDWERTRRAEPPPGPERFARLDPDDERRYERPPPPRRGPDLAALFLVIDALRRVLPRELEGQLTALLRELLLTLRSLIDWYLERLDRDSREPEIEEIPID